MPRRLLQRYLPHPDTLRRQRSLRFMGQLIGNPSLWMLSRRSVANAFFVGLFCALLPIPGQMALAALGAWFLRANLPLSVGLVWITNPLTMPLIFYGNYRLGAWLLDGPVRAAPEQLSTGGSPSRCSTSSRHWHSARWWQRWFAALPAV